MSDTNTQNTQNTQNAGNAGPVAAAPAQGKQLPEACEHTTRHSIAVNGGELDYAATVGTILIDTPKVPKAASIFFTAFDLVNGEGKTDPARPVTFIFNGGPGSSTTFLLMGSIAPKRINVPDAAPVPAAPYALVDNAHTLLPVSDLVFIDAAGAGFSEILDAAKPELWSVDGDVAGFSAFIRAYLSKHHRWNSPKYVLGESYGTTRGAALAYRLQQDGVALNGLTLISNVLDYTFTSDLIDEFYVGYFPSYASVAKYHGRAASDVKLDEHLKAARAFAAGPLRLALAAGDSLDDETRHKVARRYAELTGLDERYVYDSNLRVSDPRFRKALLHDEDKIVGRYDGRVAGYDLDRMNDEETFVVDDAWLEPVQRLSARRARLGPRAGAQGLRRLRLERHRAGQGLDVVAPDARRIGLGHDPTERAARSGRGHRAPADHEGAARQRRLRPVHAVLPDRIRHRSPDAAEAAAPQRGLRLLPGRAHALQQRGEPRQVHRRPHAVLRVRCERTVRDRRAPGGRGPVDIPVVAGAS